MEETLQTRKIYHTKNEQIRNVTCEETSGKVHASDAQKVPTESAS